MPNVLDKILNYFFPETLHDAVEDNNADKVKDKIRLGDDIDSLDRNGRAAVHIAALQGNADMLSVLFKYQASPDTKSVNGYTALHFANNSKTSSKLIENGTSVDDKGYKGYTPLHLAKLKGKVDVVRNLLERGADLNVQNENMDDVIRARGVVNNAEIETMLRSSREFDSATENIAERFREGVFFNERNAGSFDKLSRFVHRKLNLYENADGEGKQTINKEFSKLLNDDNYKKDTENILNNIFNISLKSGNTKTANAVYDILGGKITIELDKLENKKQIDNAFTVVDSIDSKLPHFQSVKESLFGWNKNNPYDAPKRHYQFYAISAAAERQEADEQSFSLKASALKFVANNQLDGVCNHSYVKKILAERNAAEVESKSIESRVS